ncbi:hypothetical protein VHEMI03423 [[Torrubiella] hemipterigena]|uniref:Transcription factor IIIC 90kDa subunit N-terminal domain-containing protein n=1 Tax=[Torrubiella] hemipterigena TaxID=1531966 RepID=A0A0A1SSH5_9HYPO|nr:hypothetical protein VHEMI03423 [[Torrubiella] hemipterigena]
METSRIPQLQSIALKSRPISPLAISWSCDAELAIATDDGIYIYLPVYPNFNDATHTNPDALPPQLSLSLQTTAVFKPNPAINAKLCAFAGAAVPTLGAESKGNSGPIAEDLISASASAIGQAAKVEWSPNMLGFNRRPVLAVLTTHGELIVVGEDATDADTLGATQRTRNFKNWKLLWGIGPNMPLPVQVPGVATKLQTTDERIVSFAWAKETTPGTALLAVLTHLDDVVAFSVQLTSSAHEPQKNGWRVDEVVRFKADGPHEKRDEFDVDFVPSQTAFSLSWSPWVPLPNGGQSSTLSYTANNYIGFRRVTITTPFENGQVAPVEIESHDTLSICLHLHPNAFVTWENAIWPQKDYLIARGIICTPFVSKPFQVALTGPVGEPFQPHDTETCATTYSPEDEDYTNPITGLIIHQPNPSKKPDAPVYTLVRLSATASNDDWFETTLNEDFPVPQWAEDISQRVSRRVARSTALQDQDSDSDSEEDDGNRTDVDAVEVDERESQVYPHMYRFWGLASSPGDGTTVVLVSRHKTQHADRKGLSKLQFGWYVAEENSPVQPKLPMATTLSTEAKLWEWMYGNGEGVPGTGTLDEANDQPATSKLKSQFKSALEHSKCTFCDEKLEIKDDNAICVNRHAFILCVSSGLPIMAPGTSRLCAVCKSRCLMPSELERIAKEYLKSDRGLDMVNELCGGCKGKFVM